MAAGTTSGSGGRKRVVILGGGFAGINAAMGLGKLPLNITLVDRKNHHTFQPLLYQVALAVLSPGEIAQPIRSILRNYKNIEVLMDEAVSFDIAQQRVNFKTGAELEYDYLIVATGSTHSYFGKDEWAKLAPGLKTVEDATEIRRRVLLAFELAERQMQETGSHPSLNFVIIGGGPTGVELAGAISDIAKLYMAKDFRHIDPRMAQVLILEGSPHILTAYPEDLQAKADAIAKTLNGKPAAIAQAKAEAEKPMPKAPTPATPKAVAKADAPKPVAKADVPKAVAKVEMSKPADAKAVPVKTAAKKDTIPALRMSANAF